MRISSVRPQNYIVNTTTENGDNENIHRNQNKNCTPTKRCLRFFGIITVVALVVICAIIIPVVVSFTRNKKLSESQMVSTTEILPSLETMITTTFITTISSNFDTQSMVDMNTLTESVNNGSTDTISTGTDNMIITITPMVNTEDTNSLLAVNTPQTTTTARPLIKLNRRSDIIVGLYNTVAGQSTGGFNDTFRAAGIPHHAMDDLTRTKYFNFGRRGSSDTKEQGRGIGSGFFVIPSISNSTVACGLLFATANDVPDRDPINVTLEGSNETNIAALNNGSSWTLIYRGPTGINATNAPGRQQYGIQQNFNNEKRFTSYRLLITSRRGVSDAVQYSEAQIMGYI